VTAGDEQQHITLPLMRQQVPTGFGKSNTK